MNSISIICPVFNEENAIIPFYDTLLAELDIPRLKKYKFNLLFSNNCSTDNTEQKIKYIIQQNKYIKVDYISLSKNFGYQASLTAALDCSDSDAYIIIDVDLEDPAWMILEFILGIENGYEYIYGIRKNRPEPFFISMCRKIFYRLTFFIADFDFLVDVAEFSMFTHRFKEAAISTNTTFPFLRAEFASIGFKRLGIPYAREVRQYGKTHYNFLGMLKFAFAGMLSSSTFPLRFTVYFGLISLFIEIILFILNAFYYVDFQFISLFIFKIYIYIALSSIAIYIARSYKNGIARPIYVVDWKSSSVDPILFRK